MERSPSSSVSLPPPACVAPSSRLRATDRGYFFTAGALWTALRRAGFQMVEWIPRASSGRVASLHTPRDPLCGAGHGACFAAARAHGNAEARSNSDSRSPARPTYQLRPRRGFSSGRPRRANREGKTAGVTVTPASVEGVTSERLAGQDRARSVEPTVGVRLAPSLAIAAISAVAVGIPLLSAFSTGAMGIPHNDDWAYSRIALDLAEHGGSISSAGTR